MIPPLPVSIIGGYLGAGKTTLINHMLRHANGQRLAILVNEFGELPIDADLIEAQSDDLISIAGGCICCSFGSDLSAALMQLAALSPRPDHVVIEASGVALPGAIAHSVAILDGFAVNGISVLADAAQIQTLRQDEYMGDTVQRQLSDADLIVLTKCDVTPDDQVANTAQALGTEFPNAQVLRCAHANIPNDVILGVPLAGLGGKSQHHANFNYDSVVLEFTASVDVQDLQKHLLNPTLGVIRAKGFVPDISGRMALVQIVSKRCDISFVDHTGPPALVCIGVPPRFNADGLQRLQQTLCP